MSRRAFIAAHKLSTPTRRCGVPTGAVGSAPAVTGRGIYLAGTAAQERTANTVAHAGQGGGCLRAWTVDTTGHGSVVPASPRGRATGHQFGASLALTRDPTPPVTPSRVGATDTPNLSGLSACRAGWRTASVARAGMPGASSSDYLVASQARRPTTENADSRATPSTERSAVKTPGA